MKLAIIGSREFKDKNFLYNCLDEIHAKNAITLVVSGGCRGPDSFGEEWAKLHEIPTKIFYPDWDRYGKSAGFRRNVDIINNCDKVVAFQVNKSKGTQHSINIAKENNKEIFLYEF